LHFVARRRFLYYFPSFSLPLFSAPLRLCGEISSSALQSRPGEDRRKRAMHHSPKVRFKHAMVIFERNFFDPPVDRNAGVVDPRFEAAEAFDRGIDDALDIGWIGR